MTFGEVKKQIHRINERIRYSYNKYGANNAVTNALVQSANRLIVGTGVVMTENKSGIPKIAETESNINKIISNNLRPSQGRVWLATADMATTENVIKRLRSQYGTHKSKNRADEVKKLTETKVKYDTANRLIDKLLDSGVLGSDDVNEICFDRHTGRRKIDEYLKQHPNFDENNLVDLEDLGNYLLGVGSVNAGRDTSQNYGLTDTGGTSEDFIGSIRGRSKKFEYSVNRESKVWGDSNKPNIVKPFGGWTKL